MVKVTDYERIATIVVTQLGQCYCPKCKGVCDERSPERRSPPGKRREWDCKRCGRGWIEVPAHVRTVEEAHAYDDL
jgi:transposase-like protein